MKITLFGREIKVPKKDAAIELLEIFGFNLDLLIKKDKRDNIEVMAVTVVFNDLIAYNFNFTHEFLRDSTDAELLILKSIFNAKTSTEILNRINNGND